MSTPDVSIVIPSYNGKEHLAPLLGSLRELDYPGDRLEIVLVDDASTDGTAELVTEQYSEVRLVRNEQNRHFAYTVNRGAREAKGEYVVFLNNDTRSDPGLVKAFVETLDSDPGCRAVAARILDWDGGTIIYNGAYANFAGKGFEEQCPVDSPEAGQYRPSQLLACGGAMLVHRQTFLELGGFDQAYGIYYEDLDFGWRLNLAGHRVCFCPKAIVYHHLHAFMGGQQYAVKAIHYERNALWTIYKNMAETSLAKALPAALLLASLRTQYLSEQARVETQSQLNTVKLTALQLMDGQLPERLSIWGSAGQAHLQAVNRFLDKKGQLKEKREKVQSLRTVSDEELFTKELFPDPFRMWAYSEDHDRYLRAAGYEERWQEAIELFDLRALFEATRE
jgi:GT2 family glycosyltransferase